MKTVLLLMGGWSAEREVSLNKGRSVRAALQSKDYHVVDLDLPQDLSQAVSKIREIDPDVVFNNLYGQWGEDGHVQALLNMLKIPYTHSGLVASAVGMNKPLAKEIAQAHTVDVAQGMFVKSGADITAALGQWGKIVIKPCAEGSSIETYILDQSDNRIGRIAETVEAQQRAFMAEEFIAGQELTVAVLDGRAYNVTEIIAAAGFFDYEAKYVDQETRYEMPAAMPEQAFNRALQSAEVIYQALACRGLARCDFRYDPEQDRLCFLEINTQPGLTAESIAPSQIIAAGMSFADLCAHLVETARCD